jgi:penicillin G amidase
MPDWNQMFENLSAAALRRLSRLPQTEGERRLPGLSAPVSIQRDDRGVPHIFASTQEDLYTAQGYVHAQDRLFQMDFNRRMIAGRLSEILGEVSLPLDRWMRTLTMRRVAEFEVSLLNPSGLTALEAYARGVNAFIQHGPLPVEFTLLRYQPEPWQPADTLAWIKMLAWGLCVNWETEILRARLIERLGPEKAAELEPAYFAHWPTILPGATDFSGIGTSALARAAAARPFSGPSPYSGVGSNCWVVHGTRTASGKPLLANDMHLSMGIPAIWYENHLECPTLLVTGVTFPGIPGIVSGHNGKVAWGYTNGFADVQDLYMEHLRRKPDGGVEAEFKGTWEPVTRLQETIQVKGKPDVQHEVLVTRHGPVINELSPELMGETPLALRWTALEPNGMIECMGSLFRAQNCQEFHEALRGWHTPSQNTLYADVEGNIGYTLTGAIPVRAEGDGSVPVPGWTGEFEWTYYIPFEDLPHQINPPQGYFASANNRVAGAEYPYNLGRDVISGNRAGRISELLESQAVLDLTFFEQMHFDQVCPPARRITAILGSLPISNPALTPILDRMRVWDGILRADSPEAAVYEVFYRRLVSMLLSEPLDEFKLQRLEGGTRLEAVRFAFSEFIMGKGPTPILMETSLFGYRTLEWLESLLQQPESPWYNLGGGQQRQEIVEAALQDTQQILRTTQGERIDDWAWGKLHQIELKHPLGSAAALRGLLNRGPFPLGGDQHTVWATGAYTHQAEGQSVVSAPYRMLVDLGNLENSRSILAPGQSGRPTSPFYDDQLEAWFTGAYHPILYTPQSLAKHPLRTLRLVP